MNIKTYSIMWESFDVFKIKGLNSVYSKTSGNQNISGATGILKSDEGDYRLYYTSRNSGDQITGIVNIYFIPVIDSSGNHISLRDPTLKLKEVAYCYLLIDNDNIKIKL